MKKKLFLLIRENKMGMYSSKIDTYENGYTIKNCKKYLFGWMVILERLPRTPYSAVLKA